MMKTVAHDVYVAPMGTGVKQTKTALIALGESLYRRDLIADRVQVNYMDVSDGHYWFMLIGLKNDVARLANDWQAMDEERIG